MSNDCHAREVASRLFQWVKPGKLHTAFLESAGRQDLKEKKKKVAFFLNKKCEKLTCRGKEKEQ